jgi:GDPmannose 4,6-dehydratase
MSKRALITGITGMDGSHITDLLLEKGYEVFGVVRRASTFNTQRIDHIRNQITLLYGDLMDQGSLENALKLARPHEIYHLAAMSHVRVSFDTPKYTVDTTGVGTLNLLEAVRSTSLDTSVRIYNACSSEMFGKVLETPQKETTPFNPCSPYGCAKVFSHNIASVYRQSYNMFICNGILFNHESERRGNNFVTQKIARGVAEIIAGTRDFIELGNLDARRDWGYSPEYVQAMWLMLQHELPDDYVVATGETHSVRDFVTAAFEYVGVDDWEKYVVTNSKYFRPAEVDLLLGDASKIKRVLNWTSTIKFNDLVGIMVQHQLDICKRPYDK